jgi:PhnB protein
MSAMDRKTSIAPMLSVRWGARAIEFYKAAFGAQELFRVDDDMGRWLLNCAWGEPNSGSPTSPRNT